jgi:hypothetical protein
MRPAVEFFNAQTFQHARRGPTTLKGAGSDSSPWWRAADTETTHTPNQSGPDQSMTRRSLFLGGNPTGRNYFLRWRIRARIRRFLRPIFRRPRPVFLTPTSFSSLTFSKKQHQKSNQPSGLSWDGRFALNFRG